MADESSREDRIILTVGAIGRGIMSDPDTIQRLEQRQRLEEALEPFRKRKRKGGHRSFEETLEEDAESPTDA